jgi:hypothetical protein
MGVEFSNPLRFLFASRTAIMGQVLGIVYWILLSADRLLAETEHMNQWGSVQPIESIRALTGQ